MAEQAHEQAQQTPLEAVPLYDPSAVERTYRKQRAKRRAFEERSRARRHANLRFWAVVFALIGLSVYFSVAIWHEIQRLFGL